MMKTRCHMLKSYTIKAVFGLDSCGSSSTALRESISWREIYECLEACADAFEHASECVDSVIMKNT